MNCFALFVILIFVVSNHAKIKCPLKCKCDKMGSLKRVQCTKLNLFNIGSDIPYEVEALDLSYNQINLLGDREFSNLNLLSLKLLNMSHNKIGHMHINAFKGLHHIRTIDLSFNAIEYTLTDWFDNISSLKELYLSGNNFLGFSNGPLLSSESLEVLDISFCQISHIKEDTFIKLGNLRILRINGNNLIQLDIKSLVGLKNLKIVALEGNQWHCNNMTIDLIKYLTNRGVKFVDMCKKPVVKSEEKFQRMVNSESEKFDENIHSWVDDIIEDNLNKSQNCNCTLKMESDILLEIIKLSPLLSIVIPFVVGFVIGLIITCNLKVKSYKFKSQKFKRFDRIRADVSFKEYSCPLVLNETILDSTPISKRKNGSVPLQHSKS